MPFLFLFISRLMIRDKNARASCETFEIETKSFISLLLLTSLDDAREVARHHRGKTHSFIRDVMICILSTFIEYGKAEGKTSS